jgi:hypothetical protein
MEEILISIFVIEVLLVLTTSPFCFYIAGAIVAAAIYSMRSFFSGFLSNLSASFPNRPLHSRVLHSKAVTTATQLVLHSVMAAWEYTIIQERNLLHPGAIRVQAPMAPSSSLLMMYSTQIAIWIYEGASLLHTHSKERRKDFFVLLGHHVVTIALLVGSAMISEHWVGAVVLFYHDVTDITIDILKLLNYLKCSGAEWCYAVETLFVLNLMLWLWMRMYRFFDHVIIPYTAAFTPNNGHDYLPFLVTLLLVLYCMHVWWTFLFLRIAYRMVGGEDPHQSADVEYETQGNEDKKD